LKFSDFLVTANTRRFPRFHSRDMVYVLWVFRRVGYVCLPRWAF